MATTWSLKKVHLNNFADQSHFRWTFPGIPFNVVANRSRRPISGINIFLKFCITTRILFRTMGLDRRHHLTGKSIRRRLHNRPSLSQKVVSLAFLICFFCIETWPQHQKVSSKGVFHHLKQAHDFEILRCKVCDYATIQKDSFIEHERSHTSDKLNTSQEDLESEQNCTPKFDSETLLSPKAAEKCRESAASTPSSISSYDLKIKP